MRQFQSSFDGHFVVHAAHLEPEQISEFPLE